MKKETVDILTPYCAGWVIWGLGHITVNEFAGIVGALSTVGGFLITWYYKHKAYKLEKLKNGQKAEG